MRSELKPVRCGCGGEARIVYIDGEDSEDTFVECTRCRISIPVCPTEEEAVEDWNRAMGERTAKVEVVEKPNVFKCSECGQYFHSTAWGSPVEYCSRCGAKLDWSER